MLSDDLRYYYSAVAQVAGTLAGIAALTFTYSRQRLGSRDWRGLVDLVSGVVAFGGVAVASCLLLFLGASQSGVLLARALLWGSLSPIVTLFGLFSIVKRMAHRADAKLDADEEPPTAVSRWQRIALTAPLRPWRAVSLVAVLLGVGGAGLLVPGRGNTLDERDLYLTMAVLVVGLVVVTRSLVEAGKPAPMKVNLVRRFAGDERWDIAVFLATGNRPVDSWRVILYGLPNGYAVTYLHPGCVSRQQPASYQCDSVTMGSLDANEQVLAMTFEPEGEPQPGNFDFAVSGRDVEWSKGSRSILHVRPAGEV